MKYFWCAFWAYLGWRCGEYTFAFIGLLWRFFLLKFGGTEI